MDQLDTPGRPTDWSRDEVVRIVADYLEMLELELDGMPVNKAARNAALRRSLVGRSRGAVEFKHANISAVLNTLHVPYVDGYKPRGNYQGLLEEVVVERLRDAPGLFARLQRVVTAPIEGMPHAVNWARVEIPPPKLERPSGRVAERPLPPRSPVAGVNYLAREAENMSLGIAGERFVVDFEHRRLWSQGARRLADRVEHVAQARGDGLGYDVLSFDADGRERLIEVKTTRFGEYTPFFATRNEVEVSSRERDRFHLYRVFAFAKSPRLFVLPGALQESVTLDPIAFRATLR